MDTATASLIDDTATYLYDAAGRLEAECVGASGTVCPGQTGTTAGSVALFTFDAGGNLTETVDPTGNVTANTFTATDELVSSETVDSSEDPVSSVDRVFDDAGRLTSQEAFDEVDVSLGEVEYEYNAVGRVEETTLTPPSGPAVTFEAFADPLFSTVAQYDGTDTVYTMWDHSASTTTPALLEHGDAGFLSPDGSTALAAVVPDGQSGFDREWLVTDSQGTSVSSVDSSGGPVTSPSVGDVWGAGTPEVAGVGFLSLPDTPAGLSSLRARGYDPGLASFTTPDPLGDPVSGGITLGAPAVSTYLYGYGSPALFYDPSGLFGLSSVIGFVGDVGGAVSNVTSGVGNWVWEHKRQIGTVAAVAGGLAAGIACGATVVCGVIVGAASGAAVYASRYAGTDQFNWSEFGAYTAAGGVLGGLGAGSQGLIDAGAVRIAAAESSNTVLSSVTSVIPYGVGSLQWGVGFVGKQVTRVGGAALADLWECGALGKCP